MIYPPNQGALESAMRGLLIKSRDNKNKPGLSWANGPVFHSLSESQRVAIQWQGLLY